MGVRHSLQNNLDANVSREQETIRVDRILNLSSAPQGRVFHLQRPTCHQNRACFWFTKHLWVRVWSCCLVQKDWRDVKDYLVDNLVKSHLYNFDYKEASCTLGVYYSAFNELRLPPATTEDDSESEELQSIIQPHYLCSPYHYTHPGDNNPPRTYYVVMEDSELEKWETTGRNALQLSTWKSTTSKVDQHLHLFEHPHTQLDVYYGCACQRKATPCGLECLPGDCATEELASLLQERWLRLRGAGQPQRCTT